MRQRALVGNDGEKTVDVTGMVVALERVYLGRLGVEANFEGHRRLRAVADGGEAHACEVPDDALVRGRERELAKEEAEDDLCDRR